jgi:hypothetical protein
MFFFFNFRLYYIFLCGFPPPPPPPIQYTLHRLVLLPHEIRGCIQRQTWCMGPYVVVDYTSPYVDSRVDSNT